MSSTGQSIEGGTVARVPGAQATGYAPQPVVNRRGASPIVWILGAIVALAICGFAAAALGFWGVVSAFQNLPSVTIGTLRTESHSVPQSTAGSVAVNLNMGYGTLALSGGASNLLDGDFTYNVDTAKPSVLYSEATSTQGTTQGVLSVEQSNMNGFVRTPDGVRNDWNLRLKDGVPMTLSGSLGAGTSNINLGGLSVSKLDLSTGAGQVTLDLTGNWKQNLDATLSAGVGETIVRLPKDAGVRVEVDGGLGKVDGGGLNRDGNTYTNSAYGKTPVTLDIKIKTGVGNVKLIP